MIYGRGPEPVETRKKIYLGMQRKRAITINRSRPVAGGNRGRVSPMRWKAVRRNRLIYNLLCTYLKKYSKMYLDTTGEMAFYMVSRVSMSFRYSAVRLSPGVYGRLGNYIVAVIFC